jgi:hypothetical protein
MVKRGLPHDDEMNAMIKICGPKSNAQRQREFRARNPGYRNKYRYRSNPTNVPAIPSPVLDPAAPTAIATATEVGPEPTQERREPTEERREPTRFDPFPPFERKQEETPQEEKPIDLSLAGLAM